MAYIFINLFTNCAREQSTRNVHDKYKTFSVTARALVVPRTINGNIKQHTRTHTRTHKLLYIPPRKKASKKKPHHHKRKYWILVCMHERKRRGRAGHTKPLCDSITRIKKNLKRELSIIYEIACFVVCVRETLARKGSPYLCVRECLRYVFEFTWCCARTCDVFVYLIK